ncbi:MAG: prolipoprotein diacylglyceryl transferase [Oscillospiraceae bacterium]|nr:prolipoprotein diacylglyceryl transferase [Oscillospiraceae bacterium]
MVVKMIEFPNLFSGITISAGRVAFNILGVDIYWYGIIITAAVVLGIMYAIKFAARAGIISDDVFETAFWGVISGFIGARAYYVFFWNANPDNLTKYNFVSAVTGIRDGGLAIYGGLIGALIGGVIAARFKKVRFAPLSDLIGLGFLIGHSVGRWGNFFNQEAFGAATAGNLPWGMTGNIIERTPEVIAAQAQFGNSGFALVHPCFLYESLWCLLGLVILHFYMKKFRTFDGEIFLLYLMWYGTGRAFIESLRLDSLTAGGLRVSQVLAILSAVLALGLFIRGKIKYTPEKGYTMYKNTCESKRLIEGYGYKVKLENEKEKAKNSLEKTKRELTEPFDTDN